MPIRCLQCKEIKYSSCAKSLTRYLFRVNGRLTLRSKLDKPLPNPGAMILRSFPGRLDRSMTQVRNIAPFITSKLPLTLTPASLPSLSVCTSPTKSTGVTTSPYVLDLDYQNC